MQIACHTDLINVDYFLGRIYAILLGALSPLQRINTFLLKNSNSLRSLCLYVQKSSEGDPAKILTSGFAVEKARGASRIQLSSERLMATFGDEPGEIDLSWKPIAGRPTFEIYVSDSDTTPYRYVGGSTKMQIHHPRPGQRTRLSHQTPRPHPHRPRPPQQPHHPTLGKKNKPFPLSRSTPATATL